MYFKERVKLFIQHEETWADVTTGYLTFEKDEKISLKTRLLVKTKDDELVLASHVKELGKYHVEHNSLMLWSEGRTGPDVCISFLESVNRDKCVDLIKELQAELTPPSSPEPYEVTYAYLIPTVDNLAQIEGTIRCKTSMPNLKVELVSQLIKIDFVARLKGLYLESVEKKDVGTLHNLYNVVMALLRLYDVHILEALMSDELVGSTMGMLENDPKLLDLQPGYREYIEDPNHFHMILDFNNPVLLQTIHASFRLTYLKDIMCCRGQDPQLDSLLGQMVANKNNTTVNYFNTDTQYLSKLVKILENDAFTNDTKRGAIKFIQHLCRLSKGHEKKKTILEFLINSGIKTMFKFGRRDNDETSQDIVCEIMLLVVDQDPGLVRRAIINDIVDDDHILKLLIEAITKDPKESIAQEYSEFIKALLVNFSSLTTTRPPVQNQNNFVNHRDIDLKAFVEYFYVDFANDLLDPLLALSENNFEETDDGTKKYQLSEDQQLTCFTVCELLVAFLRSHPDAVQALPDLDKLMSKVKVLIFAPKGHLQLSAVRVFRTMMGSKRPALIGKLIDHDVIKELIIAYKQTSQSRNMLNSAVLEFMEFIRIHNLDKLLNHISDSLKMDLADITDTKVFEQLLELKQINEVSLSVTPTMENGSNHLDDSIPLIPDAVNEDNNSAWGTSTLDKESERYFNSIDDTDEEPHSQAKTVNGDRPGKTVESQQQSTNGSDLENMAKPQSSASNSAENSSKSQVQSANGAKLKENTLNEAHLSPPPPSPSNNPPPKRPLVDYSDDEDDEDGFTKLIKPD